MKNKKLTIDRRKLLIIIGIVCFVAALLIAVYPIISNVVNERDKSLIITEYSDIVKDIDDQDKQQLLAEAREYNESIIPVVSDERLFTHTALNSAAEHYYEILNVNDRGMMAYIDIPKVNVYLPIYHGTDALTLEDGIGHLVGTSLPVGGESTHCVISGHSGLSSQRMFSDIEELDIGDMFYIHVLGDTLAYEVYEIQTVLPEEVDTIRIIRGEDLCTLVTCTPFGVNTHRLLVTGVRVPYVESIEEQQRQDAASEQKVLSSWDKEYLKGLLIGGSIVALAGITILTVAIVKKQRRKQSMTLTLVDIADYDEYEE